MTMMITPFEPRDGEPPMDHRDRLEQIRRPFALSPSRAARTSDGALGNCGPHSYEADRWTFFDDGEGRLAAKTVRIYLGPREAVAGVVTLTAYRPEPTMGLEQFYFAMDARSGDEEAAAGIICSNWGAPKRLAAIGPILLIDRAWVRPLGEADWPKVVEAVIRSVFRSRWSVLLCNANPLEYVGENRNNPRCLRRQRALVRLYQRMGMLPLSNAGDGEGWMWRPNPKFLDCAAIQPKNRKTRA